MDEEELLDDSKVMAEIERNTTVNPQNYVAAANYYFSTGRDLKQAIKWMEMFIPGRESQFWNTYTYAQMLLADGQLDKAREAATKSMERAKASGNDFGYIKRNEDLLAEIDQRSKDSGKRKKK